MDSNNFNLELEPLKTILNIIDILSTIKLQKLILGGGEPFLRPDIFEIIKKSKEYFKTTILTNGTYINDKNAEKLKDLGIDGVSVSFESTDRKIHNKYRDNSYFDALNAMKTLKSKNIAVDMGVCVSKNNVNDYSNLIKRAEDLNLDSITFEALNPSGRGINLKDRMLNSKETERFLNNIHNFIIDEKPSIKILMFYPQWIIWDKEASGCEVGESLFALRANGDILPCSNLPIKLGNILKDDFDKIWTCDLLEKLRNKRTGHCECCFYKKSCGGCRSQALKNGDIFSSDPTCHY